MSTVIVFIIIIAILIFVHELGHFLLAKRSGARVEEFGFGFPPRILGFKKVAAVGLEKIEEEQSEVRLTQDFIDPQSGEEVIKETDIVQTEIIEKTVPIKKWQMVWGNKNAQTDKSASSGTIYSINAIPLGGFVKILGEDGQEKNNQQSFAAKKIWQRALILAAGVVMNFLLAVFLLSLGYFIGLPTAIDDSQNVANAKVQITQVVAQSPAEAAGIKVGDAIIKMLGPSGQISSIQKVSQVQDFTAQNKGQEIIITLEQGSKISSVKITPRVNPPVDQGALGIGLARIADISYSWYESIYNGAVSAVNLAWLIISAVGVLLWHLITQGKVAGELTGPVGIYNITGQAAQMGFIYLLQLTALLSINLAIINILPFPALDGGRILFLIIEKIKGSPVSQRIEQTIHTTGFVFLILLMVLITVRDVIKLF